MDFNWKQKSCHLIVGDSCSMNCSYCHEHNMKKVYQYKINENMFPFLRKIHPDYITFYGGEPLMYFDVIKRFVDELEDTEKFSTMTNGVFIDKDMVRYLNQHKFKVNLSWDGPNTILSRGRDVIDENWHNIRNINEVCLLSFVNAYNYPLEILDSIDLLDRDYWNLHRNHLLFNLSYVIKFFENDVFNIDLERMSRELELILTKHDTYARLFFYKSAYKSVARFFSNTDVIAKSIRKCGNGFGNVVVSIDGSLFLCVHDRKRIGNIDEFDKYEYLVKEYDRLNFDNQKQIYELGCSQCLVSPFCSCGCHLGVGEKNFSSFCELEKAFWSPILRYFELI